MADVARLKKKAAEYEAKRQYERAIGVYEQITRSIGSTFRDTDVLLFNRLGDLYLRIGDVARGVTMHEKAVDMYAELGFFNNAIALCNKILRQSPGHSSIYYKLGKISAKKGFISDAKQNFLEYSSRMQKAGHMDEAFRALKEFADLCPGQDDVRLMLAEQFNRAGRPDEALEQLQLLHEQLVGEGRDAEAAATAERIRAIDPAAVPRRPSGPVKRMDQDLIFLDVNEDFQRPEHTTPVEGLVPTSLAEAPGSGEVRVLTPQEFGAIKLPPPAPEQRAREFHRPHNLLAGLPVIEDYDERFLDESEVSKVKAEEFAVAESAPPDEAEQEAEQETEQETEVTPPPGADQATGAASDEAVPDVPQEPEQWLRHTAAEEEPARVEPPAMADETLPAFSWPEHALASSDEGELTPSASLWDVQDASAQESPDEDPVEQPFYAADELAGFTDGLVDSSATAADFAGELTDSAAPVADSTEETTGAPVVELPVVPDQPSAEAPRARPDDHYVDLGEWLRETQTPRSTRMITDEGELPPEGEQADFDEMLAKFKAGVAQNMDADDYGSHYDLAIAFREMGLLDEAIAEFQKALRGREHRIATYEALGQCFIDKRQYEVAVTVLQRAVREPGFEDERGLGVLYFLGYANERMVRYAEAARYYQRVFAVDINFRDINQRISAVAQAAG